MSFTLKLVTQSVLQQFSVVQRVISHALMKDRNTITHSCWRPEEFLLSATLPCDLVRCLSSDDVLSAFETKLDRIWSTQCVVHYLIDLVVNRYRASAGYSGWKLVGFYPKIRICIICMGGTTYLCEWISGTSCNIHWLRVTPPRRVLVVSVDHNIGKRGVADAPCRQQ
jgi:hypothetical protein